MSEVLDYAARLSEVIGARPAGTEEEQQASFFIEEVMQKEAGLETSVEEFNCNPNYELPRIVCCVVSLLLGILAIALPLMLIPALILTLITAVLYILEALGMTPLSRFASRGLSQNVVAHYIPNRNNGPSVSGSITGAEEDLDSIDVNSVSTRGSRSSSRGDRKRKIVVIARYDSGKVCKELKAPFFKYLDIIHYVEMGGMALIPIVLFLRLITNAADGLLIFFNILLIVGLIASVIPIVIYALHQTAPFNEGANNNAAGVAVMAEVARRIGTNSITTAVPASAASDGRLAVMHGEDAVRASGMLPVDTDLIYDEAAQGELDANAVERKARAAEALVAEEGAVDVDAPTVGLVPERTTSVSFYGEEAQSDRPGFPTVPAPTPQPPSNVPDWFRKGIENANANKAENAHAEAPVHRSRYADALDAAERTSENAFQQLTEREPLIQQPQQPAEDEEAPSLADEYLRKMRESIDSSNRSQSRAQANHGGAVEGYLSHKTEADNYSASQAEAVDENGNVVAAAEAVATPEGTYAAAAAAAPSNERKHQPLDSVFAVRPGAGASGASQDSRKARTGQDKKQLEEEREARRAKDDAARAGKLPYGVQPAQRDTQQATGTLQAESADVAAMEAARDMDGAARASANETQTAQTRTALGGQRPQSAQAERALRRAAQATREQQPVKPNLTDDYAAAIEADRANARAQASNDVAEQVAVAGRTISYIPVAAEVLSEDAPANSMELRQRRKREISLPSLTGAFNAIAASAQEAPLAEDAEREFGESRSVSRPSKAERHSALAASLPSMDKEAEVDEDEGNVSVSVAGSFVSASATSAFEPVGDELVADMDEEEIYVDDVDDSDYEMQFTASGAPAGIGYVEMPKSRGERFRNLFRRNKREEEPSFAEAVGISDDYTAREVGKARGSWESFRDDSVEEEMDYADDYNPGNEDDYAIGAYDEWSEDDDWNGGAFSLPRKNKAESSSGKSGSGKRQTRRSPDEVATAEQESADLGNTGMRGRLSDLKSRVGNRSHRNADAGQSRSQRTRANSGAASDPADDIMDSAPVRSRNHSFFGDLPISFDETISEREQIRSFRDGSTVVSDEVDVTYDADGNALVQIQDAPLQTEVWFVALGAELADNAGIKAFVAEHQVELKGAVFVDLDAMGAGDLSVISEEGIIKKVKISSRLKRFVSKAGTSLGMRINGAKMNWRESAAHYTAVKGYQTIHLAGMKDGKPAYQGEADDKFSNLSEDKLMQNTAYVIELLRTI